MPVPAIAAIIIIILSTVVVFKNLPLNQPQPTADKSFQEQINLEASASASVQPSTKATSKPSAKPSTLTSPKPSTSPQPSQSSQSVSNSSSSSSSNNGSTNSSNSSTTSTSSPASTSTPTPAPSSCGGLCFDRGSTSVEVTEGSNVESGGSTAFAFNLTGDGSHGFLMNTSGLPAGMSLTPTSGGFAANSQQTVKVWINTNNSVSYGTYNGTVTLKQGPSYSEVGTMSITVTYKQP